MKHLLLSCFSWRGRLTPREFLRQSLLPALVLLAAQLLLPACCPLPSLGLGGLLLFALLWLPCFFLACASSPLALLTLVLTEFLWLPQPVADLSGGPLALPLGILAYGMMLGSALCFTALAARRQRALGRPCFMVQGLGLAYTALICLILFLFFLMWRLHYPQHLLVLTVVYAALVPWFLIQCYLLFRPAQASPDSRHA